VPRYLVGTLLAMVIAVPAAGAAAASCPVTQPPIPAFEPPPDEAPTISLASNGAPKPSDRFWYGTPRLWTWLQRDGHLGRRDKVFWWSAGYRDRARVEQRPNIVVTINRVGSSVTTAINELPTHAGFDGATALLTMVDFPESGCWQVTATYRGNRLAFVADVP